MNARRFPTLVIACCGMLLTTTVALAEPVSFRKDIAPIFLGHCLACHGPKKAEGSYRIDSFERLMKAGDSELPPFTAANLELSETYRRIITDDKDERMPLEGEPLPADKIALLKQWIEEGAAFDGGNPQSPLAAIVPPPTHPAPPEVYPATLPITALAFSPDGSELFVGGYHEISVWNPADGSLLRRIGNVGQRTYALRFHPEVSMLAVGGGAPGQLGEVRLYDPAAGSLVKVLGTSADVILDVQFSPDGKRLAVGGADNTIRVFDVESGAEQLAIASHSDWIMALAWNADGSRLASGSRDKSAKVFDATTGEMLVTYSGHAQTVQGVAFLPEGNGMLSAGADNRIHQWNGADGKKIADFASFGGEVYKLGAAGEWLFTSSADRTARLFEIKTKKQLFSFAGHNEWVLATAFSPAAKRVASGAFDGEVRIWNTEDGKQVAAFIAAPGFKKSP
jgi:WD40 repeat protein